MYPNKNPISAINSFINKQFGVLLPSSSSSYGISSYKKPTGSQNMSYAPLKTTSTQNMSYPTKPGQNMSYANPSATDTKPVVIAPPKDKSKLPPAADDFINNQTNQALYDTTTGARTTGAPDMLGGKPVIQSNETSAGQNEGAYMETTGVPKTAESPYLAYLKSMFDPESVNIARDKATSDYERLANIQNESEAKSLEARRLYEANLDRPGGLLSGAQQSAALSSRRTNQELADLALRESAAARTAGVSNDVYTNMINAGKSVYDAEIAQAEADKANQANGFTLSSGQIRYDAQGNPIAGTSEAGGGAYIPGADPVADGYADAVLNGKTKLENIPEEYRGIVAQAISGKSITPESSPYLKNLADQGRQAISGLLDIADKNPGIFGGSASLPIPRALRSDAYRNYEAQLDYLKGNIIPAALSAMREASKTGGALGQVSDREGAWLASSLGALNMNQSPEMVVKQLKLIDESMKRWQSAVDKSTQEGEGGLYDF